MKRLGMNSPILWAFLPTYHRVAMQLPRRLLTYHCVDDYAANPGVNANAIRADERQMLRSADLVIATSRPLADRLRHEREDVQLMPNVADVELFTAARGNAAEPDDLASIPRPRTVYVGNLASYRFDRGLLAAVADRLPKVQFVLIGPCGLGDTDSAADAWRSLRRRDNIHLLGSRPHESLPAYCVHCDVGLIPFLDNDHTRSSFPLKLWEMLGAGLPVVCTDLPSLHGVAPPEMVRFASDATSFAEAVEGAIKDSPHDREQRADLARRHDWNDRIEQLRRLFNRVLIDSTCAT